MTRRVFILAPGPPERGGGVEHVVRELIKLLGARGYAVEVFHRDNSVPEWLNSRSGPLGRKAAGSLVGYFVGRQAQRRLGQDVAAVISNSDVGYYTLKAGEAPLKLVHFYHGTYRQQAEAIRALISRAGYLYLKWWGSMVLERLSGRGKLVLCNSSQTRDEVARYFGLHGTTIGYPLDTTHFRPRDSLECRRSLGLPEGGPVGLFVGSTEPAKGFPLVRQLIARLPEVQWVLALRGNVREDLRRSVRARICENASFEMLPRLYSAADFTICPSRYESFGYVVAEALACGTPVVASPGGASRLFLEGPLLRELLVLGPDAADDFELAVRRVLKSPERYRAAVCDSVRPRLDQIMAPENWWRMFLETTQL